MCINANDSDAVINSRQVYSPTVCSLGSLLTCPLSFLYQRENLIFESLSESFFFKRGIDILIFFARAIKM